MANPYVSQGTLNRALTSLSVVDIPELNITTGYFAEQLAVLNFEDRISDYIPTTAGAVPSPRLVQFVTVRAYLNKAQGLAAQWEQQRLANAIIGDVVIVTDSSALPPYYLLNCVLENVDALNLNGTSADYAISIRGTYPVNGDLFA
jgi:hypothetical protein